MLDKETVDKSPQYVKANLGKSQKVKRVKLMIKDFEEFCLYVYVIVDDIWQEIASVFKCQGGPRQSVAIVNF